MDTHPVIVEGIVQAIKSDNYTEPGMSLYRESSTQHKRSRYSKLDLGDEALKQFHIGQKVRVTVEAVE